MGSSNYHVRSASYPPKSNPILERIEEELKKLRKSEASTTSVSETMCIGLTGLARLYKCVDDVLRMPLLAKPDNHFKPIVEGSSKLLEICNALKLFLGRLLEAVRILLRSCSNSSSAEASAEAEDDEVSSYFIVRKEMKKKAKGLILELREIERSLVLSEKKELISEEFEVISVLRCVSIINISVFESVLCFLAMPLIVSSKSKFGLISKLVAKKSSKKGNELSDVDVVLHAFDHGERFDCDIVKIRLQVLEVSLRRIEDGLNNICKQLTRARSSLVNIISD